MSIEMTLILIYLLKKGFIKTEYKVLIPGFMTLFFIKKRLFHFLFKFLNSIWGVSISGNTMAGDSGGKYK